MNEIKIDSSNTLSTLNNSWTMFSEWVNIPAETRIIQFELKGTRNAGTDNDSYFDDLFLRVGSNNFGCSMITSVKNQPIAKLQLLKVNPNPIQSIGYINLPQTNSSNLQLSIVDANGTKVNCPVNYESDKITFEKGNLASGVYFFWVREKGNVIGRGKFIVM